MAAAAAVVGRAVALRGGVTQRLVVAATRMYPAATAAAALGLPCRSASSSAAAAASAALAPAPVSEAYDVLIVGANVVGSHLAVQLGRLAPGLRVGVVEAVEPPSLAKVAAATDTDVRVFAVTPASAALLESAGVWPAVAGVRAPSFEAMQVWDALGDGVIRFGAAEVGTPNLGYIVENRVMQSALYDVLRASAASNPAALSLLCPSGVKRIDLPAPLPHNPPPGAAAALTASGATGGLARVELADGRVLTARLLVGADGAQSRVRAAANIGIMAVDYDQRGVVATLRTDGCHGTAWQRFLPSGPVALLPLWDNLASLVWSTTPAHAQWLTSVATPEQFVEALNRVLTAAPHEFRAAVAGVEASPTPGEDGEVLYERARDALWPTPFAVMAGAGKAVARALTRLAPAAAGYARPPRIEACVGPRAAFPLRVASANDIARPRVALVGDAAHSIHPLAGQGLNLGLADADALAHVVAAGAARGADPGASALLAEYEAARWGKNAAVALGMDAIKRSFQSSLGPGHLPLVEPWVAVRNVGMAAVNALPPVKAGLARMAMAAAARGPVSAIVGGDGTAPGPLRAAISPLMAAIGTAASAAASLSSAIRPPPPA